MNIALVGFTRSYNDLRWLEIARDWAATHAPSLPWSSATRTVFDLRGEKRKNFLDDKSEYDVVVLFAIYNPQVNSREFEQALGRSQGQTSLAPNHSRETWTNRLSKTNAKYLFIFRRDDSINGQWLGEIDPYNKLPEQRGVFGVSIYARKP